MAFGEHFSELTEQQLQLGARFGPLGLIDQSSVASRLAQPE